LKNASIDVIARLAPDVRVGPRFDGTRKGTVAHLAPGRRAVRMRHVGAAPGLVLFPQYDPQARTRLEDVEPARAFAKVSVNAFNFRLLGRAGYDAVLRMVRTTGLHRLTFASVGEAIRVIDELVERSEPALQRTGT
jgi:hypothetical protein